MGGCGGCGGDMTEGNSGRDVMLDWMSRNKISDTEVCKISNWSFCRDSSKSGLFLRGHELVL